ncbi:MAG: hypothetical protein ACRC0X_01925 [Brevinema sp.]
MHIRFITLIIITLSSCSVLGINDPYELPNFSVSPYLYPVGLEKMLQDHINFFGEGLGVDPKSKMPYDWVDAKNSVLGPRYYVNTTEIGLYLNIITEIDKAGRTNMKPQIIGVLDKLLAIQNDPALNWKGLFYWPYHMRQNTGELYLENGKEPASVVDNGNLAFSLVAVAGAYLDSTDESGQAIFAKVEQILENQKAAWYELYDPAKQLLRAGWSLEHKDFLKYHIDRKANESRTGTIWAILTTQDFSGGTVDDAAFINMEAPAKRMESGKNPILTWDGAIFQGLLPMVWINESAIAPATVKQAFADMVECQFIYAKEKNIPALLSAASTTDFATQQSDEGTYEYEPKGVKHLAENTFRYDILSGTPHATALAYMIDPKQSLAMLSALDKRSAAKGPYGFYDAIDNEGHVGQQYLSLDHGMFVAAFLAPNLRQDTQKYLEHKGYWSKLMSLYSRFELIQKDE